MRVDFGKDGCSIMVVADTDADQVALSAWLKLQEVTYETGKGTELDPRFVSGPCMFGSVSEKKYGNPVGPHIITFAKA